MLYEPVLKNRLFCMGKKYSDIDRFSVTDIVDAFECRIDQWYLEPVRLLRQQKGQHGAFAAMSVCCLLLDCLCQFDSGKVTSNRTLFMDFIEKRLPKYKKKITPGIDFPEVDSINCVYKTLASGAIKTRTITSIAEVLYYVYRCGILHSAHAPLCGVICGLKSKRFSIWRNTRASARVVPTVL